MWKPLPLWSSSWWRGSGMLFEAGFVDGVGTALLRRWCELLYLESEGLGKGRNLLQASRGCGKSVGFG